MDKMEVLSPNTVQFFEGNDYALWSNNMEIYLKALGVDVYLSIVNGQKFKKIL